MKNIKQLATEAVGFAPHTMTDAEFEKMKQVNLKRMAEQAKRRTVKK